MALSADQAFIQQYSRKRPRPIAESQLAEWRLRAACRTSKVEFFPPDNLRGAALRRLETDAKSVCAGCPVRRTCLQYALDNGEPHGIWGGTSSRERAQLLPPARVAAVAGMQPIAGQLTDARQL